MTSQMDPDGTNRIVQQRVREWYAELDEERNAKLLDPGTEGTRWPFIAGVQHLMTGIVIRLSSLRRHPVD